MRDQRHIPALDGLRGLALVAILAYHAQPSWLPGAPLSVTIFFTLSGFLITSLLVRELEVTGRLDLRAFWLRRARRLVPGSVAAVVLIAALLVLGGAPASEGLVGDAVSALTWSANWRFVTEGASYASLFSDPSPFQHFWSLAIEEQLYLVLPVAALVLLGRGGRHRVRFGVVVAAGIALSTLLVVSMHATAGPGGHAYYGTEGRVAEPLVGVLLALVLTRPGGFACFSRAWAAVADVAGWLALGGLGVLAVQLSVTDPRLYRGGFLVAAVLAAVVVLAATQPTSLARALSFEPLAGLGLISYAAYLFHWPIYRWVDPTGEATARLVFGEVLLTLTLAFISTTLLEEPIRRRRTRRWPVFVAGWANASVVALAVLVVASTLTVSRSIGALDLGPGVDDAVPPPPVVAAAVPGGPVVGSPTAAGELARAVPEPPTGGDTPAPPVTPEEAEILTGEQGWAGGETEPPPAAGDELRVAVVGDSLAHNLATGLSTWAAERGDVVVYDLSVSFCPLSRGGERRWEPGENFGVPRACGWWSEPWSERARAYAAFSPHVVVDLAPFSEMLDRRLPEWDDWRRPGDPSYHGWLLDEYHTLFDALRSMAGGPETRMLTLNAPCGDFDRPRGWRRVEGSNERMVAMNRGVYPLLVSAQGDLFNELCPDGEYADDLWGIEGARPDGMHLSDAASAELARRWLGPLVLQTAGIADGGSLLAPPETAPPR